MTARIAVTIAALCLASPIVHGFSTPPPHYQHIAVRPALALRGGAGGAMGSTHDFSVAAAAIFGNIRTPATLVAGACLPLGFAFPFPAKEDAPHLRALKRLNVFVAFLAVQSELLSVIFATNAINRLHFEHGTSTVMETSVVALLTSPNLRLHWIGVYVHFVLGVIGLVVLAGIRTWLAVGPRFGLPVSMLTSATCLRIFSAVNRGVLTTTQGHGNFGFLCLKYVGITFSAAAGSFADGKPGARLCDVLSLLLCVGAWAVAAWRARSVGEWVDVFAGTADAETTFRLFDKDGNGKIQLSELKGALKSLTGTRVDQSQVEAIFDKYSCGSEQLGERQFYLLVEEFRAYARATRA